MDGPIWGAYRSRDSHPPLVNHGVYICYRRPFRSAVSLLHHQSTWKVSSFTCADNNSMFYCARWVRCTMNAENEKHKDRSELKMFKRKV